MQTRLDRVRQDKTGQDKVRQDKTGQDRIRRDRTGYGKIRRFRTEQCGVLLYEFKGVHVTNISRSLEG